ncbi:uncharacterized protein GGS22DRAFT_198712 [Annulohypoxylon maeteangense]|uniref:uncharacterized protein n=1 Tax=Annulohypoxylon maeteangense TaxID=1927788 RepID=UPI002007DFCB|nr:uncharacterized protein GGS22DRAFT_198712 [Annulohypoxylon maeteangense]KAI0887416.1 hypothetical protein GGS22DRAFT_198712 [Annulohypoxylon maeteangense]
MAPDRENSSPSNMDQTSSDAEPYPFESSVTLQSIHERTTINSTLTSDYATQWGPVEAFRELVQNWWDGIIQSFKLSEQDIKVTRRENDDEIVYTAISPGSYRDIARSHECLGYIRWSQQDGAGTVEITNRQATLEPCHMNMGSTTKATDENQIGMHGEGLKIALLVLMRSPQNHAVRCRSGGFEWTFNFTNQRRLTTRLVRMAPSTISKADDKVSTPVPAASNQDTQILIGTKAKGRNEDGYPVEREEVTRDQFTNWTRAALFLQGISSKDIVRTKYGDLLTDPRFKGRIYLKSFLLKESHEGNLANMGNETWGYGYNLANGTTNRERNSMASSNDESRTILAIWESVLVIRGDLIGNLHRLLGSQIDYADLKGAAKYVQKETGKRITTYINEELKGSWCYTANEKNLNPRFDQIVEALGRTPLEVNESYWAILKDSGFRTADEEEMKRFDEAAIIPNNDNPFQIRLRRLIRGALEVCLLTVGTDVVFVKAKSTSNVNWTGTDSRYSHESKTLKIHEKWSIKQGAMPELGQPQLTSTHSILLGAAQWLVRDAFSQIPTHLFGFYDQRDPFRAMGQRNLSLCRKQAVAQGCRRIDELVQIQRVINFKVYDCGSFNKLVVKWNKHAAWSTECRATVQLHRKSTCWSAVREIVNGGDVVSLNMRCCSHITEIPHKTFPATICYAAIIPFEKESFEVQVEKGQNYALVMYNPDDLKALAVFGEGSNEENRSRGQEIRNPFAQQADFQSPKPVVKLPPQSVVPSKRPWGK